MSAATREDAARTAFVDQARWCDALGSPLTAELMRAAASVVDTSTATGRRILGWEGQADARGDAVPLRLAGGLHALVRAGRLPVLAALYPPNPRPDGAALAEALRQTIAAADAELLPWLDGPPQTNEVARSGMLYPGLVTIARLTGLPVSLHEIGSSAGLNLQLDRYGYTLGGKGFGDRASPVQIAPAWGGPAPDGPDPVIVRRRGCDLAPIDVTDQAARERLLAYVWADQSERLARVTAALAIAAADPPPVERMDAAAFVLARLAEPAPGAARVLMHSITWQYLPAPARQAITAGIEHLGTKATLASPLAWLAFETAKGGPRLTLRLWPGGHDMTLARADAHVRSVTWIGPGEAPG